MTTILVVTSLTHRALDQESLILAWLKKGYRVTVLNFFNKDPFQISNQFKNYNLITFSAGPGFLNLLKAVLKVIRVSWRWKVNLVVAHLEYPSFVSVLANFFISSRVIVYRHHSDYAILNGFHNSVSYKLTYRLAPLVIVVSNHAKRIMTEMEHVKPDKIKVVPLAFDFGLFEMPTEESVKSLREKYNAALLILAVGRLTSLKRPYHSIDVVKQLINNGIDAKLIILGVGEEQEPLEKYIENNMLQRNVFLYGFSKEVLMFMQAADFIIHPSISESSSIVVKEAGLVNKPCIVCQGIGDFGEYMSHYKNGFLVKQDNFVDEAFHIIKSNYQNKALLLKVGQNLNRDIVKLFDVNHVIEEYDILLNDNDK
jgi:glycosyltransferase involved in cell wall biosynthesis